MTNSTSQQYQELFKKALSSHNGIFRETKAPAPRPSLKSAATRSSIANFSVGEKLTLLETVNPKADELYDLFNATAVLHDGDTPTVSFTVKLSFATETTVQKITVAVVYKSNPDNILASAELSPSTERSQTLNGSLSAAGIERSKFKDAVFIAHIEWQKSEAAERTVLCKAVPIKLPLTHKVSTKVFGASVKSFSLSVKSHALDVEPFSIGVKYEHEYPKKEEKPVIFNRTPPSQEVKKALEKTKYSATKCKKAIIVALWREPEVGAGDVDYICCFGRVNNDPTKPPYFGIPLKGTIDFSMITTVSSTTKNYFTANGHMEPCDETGKPLGGVLAIRPDNQPHDTIPTDFKVTIENRKRVKYEMTTAWRGYKETFNGKAEFTKYYYKLSLNINIIAENGEEYQGLVASEVSESDKQFYNFTQEVGLIAVMFGCLAEGTMVQTKAGNIPIENIRIGDSVFNPITRSYSEVINKWTGVEHSPLLVIETQSGVTVRMTKDHPVFTSTKFVRAGNLKVGDSIISATGDAVVITSISESAEAEANVYNLDTDGAMPCFAADGIIVGTNYVQNNMEA